MPRDMNDQFEYEVALSFASQDKALAEELTGLLREKNIHVFQDEYKADGTWGKDVMDHLVNLYARKARYCVLLLSQAYPLRSWTEQDRQTVQERAFRDANEYILPFRTDDSEVSGITETTAHSNLRDSSLNEIATMLEQKLSEIKTRSGPPTQSHDLRSGNVPSTSPKAEGE